MSEIGIVHNDLKLDNILIGNQFTDTQIKIIDFGGCSSIYDRNKNHVKKGLSKNQGNPLFSSVNVITGCVPSLRDDLYSLLYIILYIYT